MRTTATASYIKILFCRPSIVIGISKWTLPYHLISEELFVELEETYFEIITLKLHDWSSLSLHGSPI